MECRHGSLVIKTVITQITCCDAVEEDDNGAKDAMIRQRNNLYAKTPFYVIPFTLSLTTILGASMFSVRKLMIYF